MYNEMKNDTQTNSADSHNENVPAPKEDESRFDTLIGKVEKVLESLPPIVIDGETAIDALKELFSSYRMQRFLREFKSNPLNVFAMAMIPNWAKQYINAAATISDIMFPKSALSNACKFVGNVAILDTVTETLERLIEPSDESKTVTNFKAFLKEYGFAQDLSKYKDVFEINAEAFDNLFGYKMAAIDVNSTIEGHFPIYGDFSGISHTADIKLLYKSHKYNKATKKLEPDDVNDKVSKMSFIVKVQITPHTNAMRIPTAFIYMAFPCCDGNIGYGSARAYCATVDLMPMTSHLMYNDGTLGMSIFDTATTGITIAYAGSMVFFFRKMICNTEDDGYIFTKQYMDIKHEIDASVKLGYSRAFALVGIPGTGKTDIAWKLVSESYSDALIISCVLSKEEQFNTIIRLFRETPIKHFFIIVDDFDKNSEVNAAGYTQTVISFFEQMHSISKNLNKMFTLIATINNPGLLGNAVIKRSERFDEVIKIKPPSVSFICQMFNSRKCEKDATNYKNPLFYPVYAYMHRKSITIADLKNIYKIMRLSKTDSESDKLHYNALDLFKAARKIVTNKSNANENYTL